MEERLQKILARAGVTSRRGAEELIIAGRVSVNGHVVRELGSKADPALDVVAVDGERLPQSSRPVYIMLHKPAGYVTTRHDPEGRATVFELVPDIPGLFTVGRLDRDTEGLLLLTTDGDWAERILHPRYNVEREYEVHVRGPASPSALEQLRAGIMLEGKPARPVAVFESGREGFSSVLTVVMLEGRRREVRLLCVAAGLVVKRLVRRRFGPLLLGWLAPGHWRNLDPREVVALAGRSSTDARREHNRARGPAPESGTGGQRRTEERDEQQGAMRGESKSAHRDRRSGSLRQVDDRPASGRDARLSVPRYRGDVSGRDGAGARPGDRPER